MSSMSIAVAAQTTARVKRLTFITAPFGGRRSWGKHRSAAAPGHLGASPNRTPRFLGVPLGSIRGDETRETALVARRAVPGRGDASHLWPRGRLRGLRPVDSSRRKARALGPLPDRERAAAPAAAVSLAPSAGALRPGP